VRLPCNFSDGIERAYWDADVALDLAEARGIRFQLYCGKPEPIGGFTFYFRAGDAWYSAPFSLDAAEQWCTVAIDKLDTTVEGAAGGWTRIDRLRLAAWRGADEDTELYVAGFAVVRGPSTSGRGDGEDARIVLVRAESAAGDARTVKDTAQRVGRFLDDLGVPFVPVSDLDLSPARLEGKRVAVLPYNPDMSAEATDALRTFLQHDGRLVSFYTLPEALAIAVGLQRGRHVSQPRPGYFASIRPTESAAGGLTGLPPVTAQASWNIIEWVARSQPSRGASAGQAGDRPQQAAGVAATWYDVDGNPTGHPAIVVTDRAAHMTHILLRDDPANKAVLLLAMIGRFLPECWEQAATTRLARAGAIGPFRDFDSARRGIRERIDGGAGDDLLTAAEALHAQARAHVAAGEYAEALARTGQLRETLTRAWCAVQSRGARDEFRGFWCHDAFGVAGMTWDAAARILAENGFTAVFPNMLWGGAAYYPSDVLPVAPEVKARGDQLAACVAACRKHGVQCHVWKVNWNMGARASADFKARMKAAGRTQVRLDGAPENGWLCPSHPENQRLEIDAMLEVAAKYDADGVHFDYIRYPDRATCYCPGCKARFEAVLDRKIADWPRGLAADPALTAQWLEFRRAQITRVVAGVSEALRARKPRVKISAAVFRNAPVDRDTIGQDWRLWCEKGYLDFVCPMNYTPFDADFERMARRQRAWAGDTPCYPGIGLSVWPDSEGVARLIEQVNITRKLETGGFIVFNYGPREATEILPLCRLGLTRR